MTQNVNWNTRALRPQTEDKVQYHIRCRPGDIAEYVLLPGDPERVPLIAAKWDTSRAISSYREHVTYTGTIGKTPVSACSTGAGGGSTASALEELAELGAKTFIRVGTTGALQEEINCGDLIICAGAVRHDGTSPQYVELAYPALAHYEVVLALIQAAENLNIPYHVGLACTTASFYCGQGRPGFGGYRQSFMDHIVEDMIKAGVLNFEMEAATVLTLSQLFKLRAGAVFAVVANRVKDELVYKRDGIEKAVATANEAVRLLAEWDALKQEAGKKYFFPGLLK
ncbi:Uridine phosphorylase [Neomoorella glycerini]|uniref:Uridine phosphorylase n=1 Tax=Neomoorella glycerini TaxID=55779 RepID=A0A6I5ZSY3_9FIRM|nr:uridine phosphorylase [Moorella glycerini]QGP93084.1 Uridine phosphorylase [Moorella glycerini]